MSDKYTDLLDTADRIAVVDLYPARLRAVISDLSAALRETSELLTHERDRLREALEGLMAHEPDYSDTLWQDAHAALKGETP